MDLKEAKVLITGGSSGIGRETARLLKSHGAAVVISGANEERLRQAAVELEVVGLVADIRYEQQVQQLFRSAIEAMSGLNVLVNNAGIGRFSSLTETSVEDFQAIWETNVKGAFLAGREAAKHFVEKGYGNIINIGSTAALRGFANGSAYVASKFALSGLTECWRAELRQHNVRVMQINPSEVITNFSERAGMPTSKTDKKLKASEIAHVAHSMLSMNDVGFITDASVWATNP